MERVVGVPEGTGLRGLSMEMLAFLVVVEVVVLVPLGLFDLELVSYGACALFQGDGL